jgi:hypothetical protein
MQPHVHADQRGHAKIQRDLDTEADNLACRRELRDPFDQELQLALHAPQIDVFWVISWRGEMEIVEHRDVMLEHDSRPVDDTLDAAGVQSRLISTVKDETISKCNHGKCLKVLLKFKENKRRSNCKSYFWLR